MKDKWKDVTVSRVGVATYVPPGRGKTIHENRPLHGLVLNDGVAERYYHFSDGKVIHTVGGSLFYLPKGSTYYVDTPRFGGCWAINFDADIDCEPFSIQPKGGALQRLFARACDLWRQGADGRHSAAMRALYEAVYVAVSEYEREYMPGSRLQVIAPALDAIRDDFTDRELSVGRLAELCGVSEVYLRRIFSNMFGMSPKAYIIRKRMDYAKQLLTSGHLEVAEVAAMCGYAEPCHFSREFKRYEGLTPGEYAAVNN